MINEIFNSHLSGYEREMAIQEAEYDTLFAKATMMLEMVDMQLEQNIREAELKVFREGGTYDDYEYLVQEADEQAGEQKKGVFATIIEAIRTLFQKIGDALSRLFNLNNVSDDTVVQCDEQVSAANKFVNDLWPTLERFALTGAAAGIGDAIKRIVSGDVMAALEKPHNKLVNFTVGKLRTLKENLSKIHQEGNSVCDKIKSRLDSDPKAFDNNGEQVEDKNGKKHPIRDMFFDALKKFLMFIPNIIKKYIVAPLKKIGAKNVDDESDAENNSENQNTENNDSNANNDDNQQQNTEDSTDNSNDTTLTDKDKKNVRNSIRDYKKNNKNAKQPPNDETLKTMPIGGYDSSSPKFNAAMDYFKTQFAMVTDIDHVEERVSLDDFLDDINNDLITESESSDLMEIQSLLEEIL